MTALGRKLAIWAAIAVLVAAEWPRLDRAFGREGRKGRERARRKANLKVIRTEDSAQPIIQATVLPLYFISGVFIPRSQLSSTLRDIADVFPVSHLNSGLFKAFDPSTKGSGVAPHDLLILAIWAVAGLAVALWRFSWSPLAA